MGFTCAEKKVFGVGYHKTGTTSLSQALTWLGYNSLHVGGASQNFTKKFISNDVVPILDGVFKDGWDALVSIWPTLYFKYDQVYPNSKFVLTTREVDSWWKSISEWRTKTEQRILKRFPDKDATDKIFIQKRPTYEEIFYLDLYGCVLSDESSFKFRYEQHNRNVIDYFTRKERLNDLLILPLEEESKVKWELLCGFLNKEGIINTEYPHLQKGK